MEEAACKARLNVASRKARFRTYAQLVLEATKQVLPQIAAALTESGETHIFLGTPKMCQFLKPKALVVTNQEHAA